MVKLGHHDMIIFLIAFGLILIIARLFAELFKKFKLPSVLGEIIAGILLGPSVLGFFSPDSFEYLFLFYSSSRIYNKYTCAICYGCIN